MPDNYIITFKDYPLIAKPSADIQTKWEDSYLPMLNSDSGLRVSMISTHAGFINQNMRAYIPSRMRDGVKTFMVGKPKKILKHHDIHADPVGIIRSAEYVDTIPEGLENLKDVQILLDSSYSIDEQVAAMKRFIKSGIPFSEGWEGLGYIKLDADIFDETAIKQVVSGLFDSVSTSFRSPGHAYCSYCGQNLVEDMCGHIPGMQYSDEEDSDFKELCVIIPGIHDYKECSLVNFDADPLTVISMDSNPTMLSDSEKEEIHKALRVEFVNDLAETNDETVFQFKDFKEENNFMKPELKKILDILKELRPDSAEDSLTKVAEQILSKQLEDGKFEYQEELALEDKVAVLYILEDLETADQTIDADEVYAEMEKELDELNMADAKLSTETRGKLPSSTFCGPDRSFPVPDCAHVTAARRLIGRYKGPGSKASILACVSRKAKALGCDTKDSKVDEPDANVINPGSDSKTFEMPTCDDIHSLDNEQLMTVLAFAEAEGIARKLKMARECSECSSYAEQADQAKEDVEKLKAELLEVNDVVKVQRQQIKILYADYIQQEDAFINQAIELKKAKLDKAAMVSVLSGKHQTVDDALSAFEQLSFEDAVSVEKDFDLTKIIEGFTDGLKNPNPSGLVSPEDADDAGAKLDTDENQDGQKPIELKAPAKAALKNIEAFIKDNNIQKAYNVFAKMKSMNFFDDSLTFDSIVESVKNGNNTTE